MIVDTTLRFYLKGYEKDTEMRSVSVCVSSTLHITTAAVSPLNEPQVPKAKIAKSYNKEEMRERKE